MLFNLPVRPLIESSIFARSTITIQDLGFASADHKTVASRKQRPKQIVASRKSNSNGRPKLILLINNTSNVHINVTLWRVRVTTVEVQKQ